MNGFFFWDCIGSRKLRPNKLWERTLCVCVIIETIGKIPLAEHWAVFHYIHYCIHPHLYTNSYRISLNSCKVSPNQLPLCDPPITCCKVWDVWSRSHTRCRGSLRQLDDWHMGDIIPSDGHYESPQKREIWYIDIKRNLMSNFGRVPWQ